MRSILVNADAGPGLSERLDCALTLGRLFDGHVSVLVDTPASRYLGFDAMGGTYIAAEALDDALSRDDATAAAIDARLARADVPFDVFRSTAEPVDALVEGAALADLVVVSRESGLAGRLAMEASAPVLAVPAKSCPAMPPRVACVAWDGSAPCTRAVRAAVPLLALAGTVKVVTVTEAGDAPPATDVLRYLSRHGIHAELESHPRRGSVEETLAIAVRMAGADLLVMGLYGKSRMREFLFGGVSAFFLTEAQAPALFLAH